MHKTIIWDWNGTLLDDLQLSIDSTNVLLKDRGLPLLTIERYKEIFGFPVIDYYKKLCFNFKAEPFDIAAKQYTDLYHSNESKAQLFPDVKDVLSYLKTKGYRQLVLSAMEDKKLNKMVCKADISQYFDGIYGIKDDYAKEKISLGKSLINELNLDSSECVMIGDTLHDAEVAEQCGFGCILFSGGHVARHRLEQKKLKVIDELKHLKNIF